jgi:hypothetical protein
MSLCARLSCTGLIAALAGCAVVNVQTAGKDDVEITRGLGIVSVQVKPGAGAVIVESVSLGMINGADGFSLGYQAASTAAVARDSCRLIVWVNAYGQLKELSDLLQDRTDVCVVRTDYSKRGGTQ